MTTEVQMELDVFETNRERNQGLIEIRLQSLYMPHQTSSRPSAVDFINAHPDLAMVSTFRIYICFSSQFFGHFRRRPSLVFRLCDILSEERKTAHRQLDARDKALQPNQVKELVAEVKRLLGER